MPVCRKWIVLALSLLVSASSWAASSLEDLSQKEALGGLRQVLVQGAGAAVKELGVPGGFLANPALRIPLPGKLREAEPMLRLAGMGKDLDALETAMNRAAEQSVSQALPLLSQAVQRMTVQDAKAILTGGNDSVTQYFRRQTEGPLGQQFIPVVHKATERIGLANQYNELASQAATFGLIKADDANLDRYVTRQALDRLYQLIGEQERAIRQDPASAIGALAKKVFGAL